MTTLPNDPALTEGNVDLPTDAEVRSISALAARMKVLEAEITADTERLKAKLDEYRHLETHELPHALRQAGTSGFELTDGSRVQLRTAYDARKLTSPEGLRWVEENGGSSLIKTAITVELDRGDLEAARELMTVLRSSRHANRFRQLMLTEEVHDKTLGAFVKRQIEDQRKDPPMELLGVHRRTYAVVGARPPTLELKGFGRR